MSKIEKLKNKALDGMLLTALTDGVLKKTKYRDSKLSNLYNVFVAQKHRMMYYKKLKKAIFKDCIKERPWEEKDKSMNSSQVWVCWLDGMENAPQLVKRCYESLQKNMPDKKITVIHKDNFSQYVELPEYIVQKWKKGIIQAAHFTDILRTELLIQKGGYWIDATVLCTDASILNIIDKQPLFMYSFYYFGFNPEIMELNNWFIYSTTNNNVLCLMRQLLYAYWKKYDRAVNYFFYHILLTMALDYYREEYERMPIVSQADAHILATYIANEYNQEKFDLLKSSTGFHKLSTRFQLKDDEISGTFYDIIIKQGKF